uniref:Uncharacterized protein n=1 Tax=Loxodonta africana TaxID=9785 RepID=G3TYA1_LOXAF
MPENPLEGSLDKRPFSQQERLGSSNFLDLANQSLLQDEALAITALEPLLTELFLPLFIAAVTGRHSQTLTAMVQAWPFTHLPLGALMKAQQPHRDILKAALDTLGSLHTPLLSKFRLGLFPMLLECYVCIQGTLNLGNLQGYLAEVRLILQQVGCPNSVSL